MQLARNGYHEKSRTDPPFTTLQCGTIAPARKTACAFIYSTDGPFLNQSCTQSIPVLKDNISAQHVLGTLCHLPSLMRKALRAMSTPCQKHRHLSTARAYNAPMKQQTAFLRPEADSRSISDMVCIKYSLPAAQTVFIQVDKHSDTCMSSPRV